ncbi:hypothetical protein BDR05DRAFT_860985, partial [Suillus weaverae]
FLDELICLKGRRYYVLDSLCKHCQETIPTICCKDCFLPELHCPSCTVERHQCLPMHHLQVISKIFSYVSPLTMLGLHIQLGHQIGDMCCNPHCTFNDDFVIID